MPSRPISIEEHFNDKKTINYLIDTPRNHKMTPRIDDLYFFNHVFLWDFIIRIKKIPLSGPRSSRG